MAVFGKIANSLDFSELFINSSILPNWIELVSITCTWNARTPAPLIIPVRLTKFTSFLDWFLGSNLTLFALLLLKALAIFWIGFLSFLFFEQSKIWSMISWRRLLKQKDEDIETSEILDPIRAKARHILSLWSSCSNLKLRKCSSIPRKSGETSDNSTLRSHTAKNITFSSSN